MHNQAINCGDIFLVDFGSGSVGHEFKKCRPAVIVQSGPQIKKSNLITVLPLTSNLNNKLDDDIFVFKNEENLLLDDSLIKVHHVMSFDYQRLYHKIGEIGEDTLQKIKQYLKAHFGL